MIEKLFPEQSSERRRQVENWQKEEQELGGGARDADLEALMAQISHLLEDANSGAEMDENEMRQTSAFFPLFLWMIMVEVSSCPYGPFFVSSIH